MARRSNLLSIATVFLACAASLRAVDTPGLRMALPADSGITIRWVSPPLDPNQLEEAGWKGKYEGRFRYLFDVDASGDPWFALRQTDSRPAQILNPIKRHRFALSHLFEGMLCLDNGAVLFHEWRTWPAGQNYAEIGRAHV